MSKSAAEKNISALFHDKLFHEVQMSSLFDDSKTFSDAIAKKTLPQILALYENHKQDEGFCLKTFIETHFIFPETDEHKLRIGSGTDMLSYINALWRHLTRAPDTEKEDSLIPLPNSYIVPGGRFQEVYYWDTYFTALGLELDSQDELILDTFKNFQYLLETNGCIPNGNRSYYAGRSQPPVMAMLFELITNNDRLNLGDDEQFKTSALRSLIQEHNFWMRGKQQLSEQCHKAHRVVKMPDGTLLNRYWDDVAGPRPESYREDQELAAELPASQRQHFYSHIRAACESGWDFSSRWLKHPDSLASVRTGDIVPVDLNCLLWKLESTISDVLNSQGQTAEAQQYQSLAEQRSIAIQKYCWEPQSGFYHDVCFSEQNITDIYSLAATFPLFFKLATQDQAEQVAKKLKQCFLKPGGLVTTLTKSPQQWDSPNGWAPLQWIAVVGLEHYGYHKLARQIMLNWNNNVELCFQQTTSLMEKYNVESPGALATGGEYQVQQGFGWTNGVTRAFHQKLSKS